MLADRNGVAPQLDAGIAGVQEDHSSLNSGHLHHSVEVWLVSDIEVQYLFQTQQVTIEGKRPPHVGDADSDVVDPGDCSLRDHVNCPLRVAVGRPSKARAVACAEASPPGSLEEDPGGR